MKRKPLLPPTYLAIAVIVMVALHFLIPVAHIIPFPWRLAGLLPLALGATLNLCADGAFRKAGTTVKPFQESTALITGGVYRICRHPMYLGFVLILLGVALLLGSLTPFLVIPLFAIAIDRTFIVPEERMLSRDFGPTWDEYREKVGRWL
jgi:protein-S-isoprenylcysteine O-methyltransferase Ste14